MLRKPGVFRVLLFCGFLFAVAATASADRPVSRNSKPAAPPVHVQLQRSQPHPTTTTTTVHHGATTTTVHHGATTTTVGHATTTTAGHG